jgi:hypothetical protein
VVGKTVAVHADPGPELEVVAGEVARYKRFKAIVGEVAEVSKEICATRPLDPRADGQPLTEAASK